MIGAYHDDPGGIANSGSAYVYNATTGALVTPLVNPAPAVNDLFGRSVAIDGNLAVVGAVGAATNTGSVSSFNTTTGALVAIMPAPTTFDGFGGSIAISGNLVVVGAATSDPGGVTNAGVAYVLDATTGALLATLNNPTPEIDDVFGRSVAIDGNLAVVGAISDNPGSVIGAGTAYVFDVTAGATPPVLATLNNPAPGIEDFFGWSVAISGNVAVVGASEDKPGGVKAGTAYAFQATTGALIATLSNPAPTADDYFGSSVGIFGNLSVIAAAGDDPGGVTDSGAVYVFDVTAGATPPVLATLNNPASTTFDNFGHSVAISGNVAVVGSYGEDSSGVSAAGSAYTFTCAALIPTPSLSPSLSPTQTPTPSPSPSASPSESPSPSATPTPSPTTSPSASTSPTSTPTTTPPATPTASLTASQTPTPNAAADWAGYE